VPSFDIGDPGASTYGNSAGYGYVPPAGGYGAPAPPPAAPTAPKPPNFWTNPGVQNAQNAENLGLSQLEAMLKQAREQMIIRFGDPALAGLAGFGLDPQAGTFAQQNYLSGNADLAKIDRAQQQRRKAIVDRLAGRGIIDSGDLGYLQGEANTTYGNEVYDARQQVLAKLNELMSNYLGQKNQLHSGTLDAYQAAYQSFLANPDLYLATFGGS
jgi:hypothetical protein